MPFTLILPDYIGRLGNRLFLFIHVLAAAMEHGFRVCNLTLQPYAPWFQELYRNSWCRYPNPQGGLALHRWARGARLVFERFAAHQIHGGHLVIPGVQTFFADSENPVLLNDPSFLNTAKRNRWNILWGRDFYADNYLKRHQNEISKFLRLRSGLDPDLEHKLKIGRVAFDWQIALHIRQGDFREWSGGRYFFPPEVFAEYAWRIQKASPEKKIQFWVCSDEHVDLKLFPPNTESAHSQSLREDLRILTSCKYILAGVSTLARSAAYLSGGLIYNLNEKSDLSCLPAFWSPSHLSLRKTI